jgi:hypothetical protein
VLVFACVAPLLQVQNALAGQASFSKTEYNVRRDLYIDSGSPADGAQNATRDQLCIGFANGRFQADASFEFNLSLANAGGYYVTDRDTGSMWWLHHYNGKIWTYPTAGSVTWVNCTTGGMFTNLTIGHTYIAKCESSTNASPQTPNLLTGADYHNWTVSN